MIREALFGQSSASKFWSMRDSALRQLWKLKDSSRFLFIYFIYLFILLHFILFYFFMFVQIDLGSSFGMWRC